MNRQTTDIDMDVHKALKQPTQADERQKTRQNMPRWSHNPSLNHNACISNIEVLK